MIDSKKTTVVGLLILDIIGFVSIFLPYTLLESGFTLLFEEPIFQIMGLLMLSVYMFDFIVFVCVVSKNLQVYKVAKLAGYVTIIFSILPIYSILDVFSYDFYSMQYGFLILVVSTILSIMFRVDEVFFKDKLESVKGHGLIDALLFILPIAFFVLLGIFNQDTNMSFAYFSSLVYYIIAGYYLLLMLIKNISMDKILRLIMYVVYPTLFGVGLVVVMILNKVWLVPYFIYLLIGFILVLANEFIRIGWLGKIDVNKSKS